MRQWHHQRRLTPPLEDRPASRGCRRSRGEWDGLLTRVLEGSPGGTTEPMHIFTTLGRADPDLFRRWLGFGGALLSGTLPGRLRELVILRGHFASAVRTSGRTTSSWRNSRGSPPRRSGRWATTTDRAAEWAPVESAALHAVDETAADGTVSDATWEALEEGLRE